MKKRAIKKSPKLAKAKPESLSSLLTEVRQLIQSARRSVSTVVDTFQVMTNFEIGRRIVEHEQKGAKRAAYGAELMKELSARLTEEFGREFSAVNLSQFRRFFLVWQTAPRFFGQRLKNWHWKDQSGCPLILSSKILRRDIQNH
jgi:hypothetical protein